MIGSLVKKSIKTVTNAFKRDRSQPVEMLALGPRAYNVLKGSGIDTVKDLTKRTETQLLNIHGLGQSQLVPRQSG